MSIQEFEKERGQITLELEKHKEKISNSSMEIDNIIATCCKLGDLWMNAEYDTCKKVQNLVFPDGIKWDTENGHYRTQDRNSVLDLFDRFPGVYKKKTSAEHSAPVNLYWVGESNSYCEIENLEY